MAYIGCELLKTEISNSVVGKVTLFHKAKETAKIDKGGLMTEDKAEGVTSAGGAMYSLSHKRWSVEPSAVAWGKTGVDTLEKLNEFNNEITDSVFTFTLVDGTVYTGTGRIVGDTIADSLDASIPFKAAGGGKLSKI